MQVIGTVVSVEIDVEIAKADGGVYQGSRLTYRDNEGKIKERAFHNNAFKFNKTLKVQLSNLKAGDSFTMEMEKKGDFWNVNSILPNVKTEAVQKQYVGASAATPSPKSTYETPEERAKKQVYIVRQSSISAAVDMLAANGGKKTTAKEVIEVAKEFEAYVFGVEFDDGSILTIPEDVIE